MSRDGGGNWQIEEFIYQIPTDDTYYMTDTTTSDAWIMDYGSKGGYLDGNIAGSWHMA
jgi:hypothetical protein